jgi:hypothetical protein
MSKEGIIFKDVIDFFEAYNIISKPVLELQDSCIGSLL